MPLTEREVVECLPRDPNSFLSNYVRWAAPQTDAPIAYHLATGLALLSITAPKNLIVRGLAGPRTFANLFALIVGRSGEDRKSTCTKLGVDLLTEVAPDLVAPEPGSEPGFVDQLHIQNPQLLHYDEFGSFLQRARDGYFAELKTRYNQAADCSVISRKKANGKGVTIDEPRVTIVAAVADVYLGDFTDAGDWSGGFMRRWLVMHANRERLMSVGPAPDAELTSWLQNEIRWRSVHETGRCVGWTPEVATLWDEWFNDVSNRRLPELIIGARSVVPTIAAKTALLLAWDYGAARSLEPWELTLAEIVPAICVAELHLKSVVSLAEIVADSRDMKDRRKVLHACMVPRTFGQILVESKMLKRRANEILETLLEEGTVVRFPGPGMDAYYLARAAMPVVSEQQFPTQ